MSGIEVLGIVSSVFQIAELGARLSVKLYTFSHQAKNANVSIQQISKDVSLTCTVLTELGKLLEDDEASKLASNNAVTTAETVVNECKKVFSDLEKALDVRFEGEFSTTKNRTFKEIKSRLRFPFLQPQIELLRCNLEKLKSTLLLMLNVIIYAGQVRSRASGSKLAEQDALIKALHDMKIANDVEFERLRRTIEVAKSPSMDSRTSSFGVATQATLEQPMPGPWTQNINITTMLPNQRAAARSTPSLSNQPSKADGELQQYCKLITTLLMEVDAVNYRLDESLRMNVREGLASSYNRQKSRFHSKYQFQDIRPLFTEADRILRHHDLLAVDISLESQSYSTESYSFAPANSMVYGGGFNELVEYFPETGEEHPVTVTPVGRSKRYFSDIPDQPLSNEPSTTANSHYSGAFDRTETGLQSAPAPDLNEPTQAHSWEEGRHQFRESRRFDRFVGEGVPDSTPVIAPEETDVPRKRKAFQHSEDMSEAQRAPKWTKKGRRIQTPLPEPEPEPEGHDTETPVPPDTSPRLGIPRRSRIACLQADSSPPDEPGRASQWDLLNSWTEPPRKEKPLSLDPAQWPPIASQSSDFKPILGSPQLCRQAGMGKLSPKAGRALMDKFLSASEAYMDDADATISELSLSGDSEVSSASPYRFQEAAEEAERQQLNDLGYDLLIRSSQGHWYPDVTGKETRDLLDEFTDLHFVLARPDDGGNSVLLK